MNNTLYPCLWFDGKAAEAAKFYTSLFKDASILESNPMVTTFNIGSKKFMCLNGGPTFTFNPSISLFIYCKTIEETNTLWNALIKDGMALMEINSYPWSERYGWLKDKFGLNWQISVVNPGEENTTIRPAMLFTKDVLGKAEEAIHFYQSVFKKSSIERLVQYPEGNPFAGKIMYAEFSLNNYPLIAMDGPGDHDYTFNEALSFVIPCDTQEEIDYYWAKLTLGGQEQPCGWVKDKFGVSWQVVPTILGNLMADPERSARVIQAFMQMKKFDIAKLLNA